tara:strand:- start:422 stop:562 length:141 start_codon:yes stop_codon:yes gene_type:complete
MALHYYQSGLSPKSATSEIPFIERLSGEGLTPVPGILLNLKVLAAL